MEQQVLSTGDKPVIVVQAVNGDLHVMGWERAEVLARARSDSDLSLNQRGDQITLTCHDDCVLRVPQAATLDLVAVNGDARIKMVRGGLTVRQASGDLGAHAVGHTTIETVSGDCVIKAVAGDLRVNRVGGDLSARDVQGQFAATAVGGDIRVGGIAGMATATAGGDISLSLTPTPGQKCQFTAGGDISARVPANANARFTMTSRADNVRVRIPGAPNGSGKGVRQVTLGDGSAEIILTAGGDISLSSDSAGQNADDLGARLDAEFLRMGDLIAQRTQEAAQIMASRIEAKAQRAARKAERMAQRVAREAEQQSRGWMRHGHPFEGRHFAGPFAPPPPPGAQPPPRPGAQPVTDEERLMVLRMVEQKKITVEQAEKLLAALEGKAQS